MIGGDVYSRVERCEGPYHTLAGSISVRRSLYRQNGERNAKVVDAISLRAGVVADGWLPQTARAMAFQVQQATAREAAASATESGRLIYSRSSFERVTHAVGDIDGDRNVDIDDDKHGDAVHTIRYGAMLDDGCGGLLHGAAGDVNELLRKLPKLRSCLLSDGAHDLVEHLQTEVAARIDRDVKQGVDFWHLIEKLGAASKLLAGEHEKRLASWRLRLLDVETAALDILGELRASGRKHVKVGETTPGHDAITYLNNGHTKMSYAALRAEGLPIGSGNPGRPARPSSRCA